MKLKYLCKDFKAFLQQIVYLTSRGYYYHCVIVLPEDKQYKYLDIDKKEEKDGFYKNFGKY